MGATNSTQRDVFLNTPKGALRGITQIDCITGQPVCTRYTRIPYALPPTGLRRWTRPAALPADFSFNDLTTGEPGNYQEFGNVCPQPEYGHSAAVLENENAAEKVEMKQSEDCLYLNIWIPAGQAPEGGWPVQIYLHGGWLQVGDAMQSANHDPFDLLKIYPRIIVSPTYRLNLFGFLASSELAAESGSMSTGNFGFWDQRLAIEWVYANISLFGGNPDNLSVGGLSAGAHSSIFQLHYDTYRPATERLIKRVFLFSNAVGIQPKATTSPECQTQFDELLSVLDIPLSLPASEKLAALRSIPDHELVSKISILKLHTFRATTDGKFISPTFLQSIHDGSFTTLLAKHGVSILLGEVANEAMLYRLVNPATSFSTMELQLNNYYPPAVTSALVASYPLPLSSAPEEEWVDINAQVLGDCQVHAVIRGFANSLLDPPPGATPLPISSVHRYRISWRAKGLDQWLDPKVLCCHACDIPIWWLSGHRAGFEEKDEETTRGLLDPFGQFLSGEEVQWGTECREDIRHVLPDGKVVVMKDELWEEGLRIWRVMAKAQGL
ncbi:hypothetical protein EG329_000368 [Mollisiaceae sp. DMI_Dod_QoI]|nr:hypothetical protein EG329_000368 [Helotiales sp. DMI_Dod_QoI]